MAKHQATNANLKRRQSITERIRRLNLLELQVIADVLNGEAHGWLRTQAQSLRTLHDAEFGFDELIPSGSPGHYTYPPSPAVRVLEATLHELVESWVLVAPDFEKWKRLNPKLSELLTWALAQERHALIPNVHRGGARRFRYHVPRHWGQPGPRRARRAAQFQAVEMFIDLLSSPYHSLLRRCGRCPRYFLNARNKLYCGRDCGPRTSARDLMRRKRDEENQAKLKRVCGVIQDWKSLARLKRPTGKEGRKWIAHRSQTSLTWLRRHERQKNLKLPKGLQTR